MTETDARAALTKRAAETGARVALESFRGDLAVETKTGKTDLVTETDRTAQQRVTETIHEEFSDDVIVGEEQIERPADDTSEGESDPQIDDGPQQVPEGEPSWVIDPIDGTSNFVRGLRIWGTSVTATVDGEAVAATTVLPALSDTYVVGPDGVTRNDEPIGVSSQTDPETFAVVPVHLGADSSAGQVVGVLTEHFGDFRRFGCSHATLAAVADGSIEVALATGLMSPWDTVGGVAMVRAAGGTVTDLAGEPWRHDSRVLVASNGTRHDDVLAAVTRAIES